MLLVIQQKYKLKIIFWLTMNNLMTFPLISIYVKIKIIQVNVQQQLVFFFLRIINNKII
jgi:hypothetical protein